MITLLNMKLLLIVKDSWCSFP